MTNALDRERVLRETIEQTLPEFVRACEEDTDCVIMNQDAFAPNLGSSEIFLLGKAIKYAGLRGKEVRIIPTTQQPN